VNGVCGTLAARRAGGASASRGAIAARRRLGGTLAARRAGGVRTAEACA